MIKVVNGERKYFDKNGVEITEGCMIKYSFGDRSMNRIEKVYRTENGRLGTDATNRSWIESGKAVPCEHGIYPLYSDETDEVEVVNEI